MADTATAIRSSEAVYIYIETYDGKLDILRSFRDQLAQKGSLSDRQVEVASSLFLKEQQFLADRKATGGMTELVLAPSAVPPGYYTVETEQYGHVTLRVRIGQQGKSKGRATIAYLTGSEYEGMGYVDGATVRYFRGTFPPKAVAGAAYLLSNGQDFAYFGKAYAVASGNCYVCSLRLTDPVSIELGIGPICRGGKGTDADQLKAKRRRVEQPADAPRTCLSCGAPATMAASLGPTCDYHYDDLSN